MECPPNHILSNLLTPESSDALILMSLSEHLVQCEECQRRLDQMSDDRELAEWRSQADSGLLDTHISHRFIEGLKTPSIEHSQTGREFGTTLCEVYHDQLPGYEIRSELGRGGMGVVFECHDTHLDRTVAVKVLSRSVGDQKARLRFVREAQAAAQLNHPHIVAVYSVADPPDSAPYFVMEFIAGAALNTIIDDGTLSVAQSVLIASQVARGLSHAHAAGLVHRDVKPRNVMIEMDGDLEWSAKIMDFGLVRFLDSRESLTETGMLAGTPAYVSPEQIRSDKSLDSRSDVYSLGVTFYEMLTGELPFRGRSNMVLRQIEEDEPVSPRKINCTVPRDLEVICLKAMSKEPQRRYQTALEMHQDLERWRKNEPIRARPVGSVEQIAQWCHRNTKVALLASVALALFVALLVGSFVAAWQFRGKQIEADSARERADIQRAIALDSLNSVIYDVQMKLGSRPDTLELRKEILLKAIDGLEQLTSDPNAVVDETMVAAHVRLGEVYSLLGRNTDGNSQYALAIGVANSIRVSGSDRATELRRELALAYEGMGNILLHSDRDKANEYFELSLTERQAVVQNDQHTVDDRMALSSSYNRLGEVEHQNVNLNGERDYYLESIAILQPLLEEGQPGVSVLRRLTTTYNRLGRLSHYTSRIDEAEKYYTIASDFAEQVVESDADNPTYSREWLIGRRLRAALYMEKAEPQTSESMYREILSEFRDLGRRDSQNVQLQGDIADTMVLLSQSLLRQEKLTEARQILMEALAWNKECWESKRDDQQFLASITENYSDLILVARLERDVKSCLSLSQELCDYILAQKGLLSDAVVDSMVEIPLQVSRAFQLMSRKELSDDPMIGLWVGMISAERLALEGNHRECHSVIIAQPDGNDLSAIAVFYRNYLNALAYGVCAASVRKKRDLDQVTPDERQLFDKYVECCLEKLRQAADFNTGFTSVLYYMPHLNSIRDQPRYREVLRGLSLPKP